jgi:hypothetical protein
LGQPAQIDAAPREVAVGFGIGIGTAPASHNPVGLARARRLRGFPGGAGVDWVDATLETTVKVMKFTHLPPICGGPIDLALITTDRPFRWARRKKMSSAIKRLSPEF